MKFNIKFPKKILGHNTRIAVSILASLLVTVFISDTVFSNSPRINYSYISSIPSRLVGGIKTAIGSVRIIFPKSTSDNRAIFSWYRPPTAIPKPQDTGHGTVSPQPSAAPLSGAPYEQPTSKPQPTTDQPPTPNPKPTVYRQPTTLPTEKPLPTLKPTQTPSTSCPTTSSETYGTRGLNPPDLGANSNPDTVMSLRGWTPSNGDLKLVTYGYPGGEPPDPKAPQLSTVVGNGPQFSSLYRVLPDQKDDSLAGLTTQLGQTVKAPTNGYDIGAGYQYLVIYASEKELTMNVTGDDQAIDGYALHFYGFCVDPNLVSLYRQLNQQSRHLLPALHGGQKMGVANAGEVKVAIRDSGTFMDPRSRLDWWKGF